MFLPPSRKRSSRATAERVATSFTRVDSGIDYYDGVIVGADTIGRRAPDQSTSERIRTTLDELEPDDYLEYTRGFTESGQVLGDDWRYADIVTALAAATELLRPTSYLEIGYDEPEA